MYTYWLITVKDDVIITFEYGNKYRIIWDLKLIKRTFGLYTLYNWLN